MIIHQNLIIIPLMLLIPCIIFIDLDYVNAVDTEQTILNQNSVPHNALGHESHQIVNLVNTTGEKIFHGTVKFNSTLPVDIIAYTTTSNNTAPSNLWNISGIYYTTDKLLSDSTQGEVDFTGSGLVAHRPSSDGFKINFTISSLQTE